MKIIAKHDGKTQGDINLNEQFLDHLNFLREHCICDICIDKGYNSILEIIVSRLGLKEIYVYYTEEIVEKNKINENYGYIYKVHGLEELENLLYKKDYLKNEDKEDFDKKIEALEVLFESRKK